MNDLRFGSLGEAWINLVQMTVQNGVSVDQESLELLGVQVAFPAGAEDDELIRQLGDSRMIAEMERVFFEPGAGARDASSRRNWRTRKWWCCRGRATRRKLRVVCRPRLWWRRPVQPPHNRRNRRS